MGYDNEGILEVTLEAVLGEGCSSLWVRRASGEVYIALKYNVCRLDFIRRRLFMVPLFHQREACANQHGSLAVPRWSTSARPKNGTEGHKAMTSSPRTNVGYIGRNCRLLRSVDSTVSTHPELGLYFPALRSIELKKRSIGRRTIPMFKVSFVGSQNDANIKCEANNERSLSFVYQLSAVLSIRSHTSRSGTQSGKMSRNVETVINPNFLRLSYPSVKLFCLV